MLFRSDVSIDDDERIIPAIYQPAIDSWKNFLREVHCHQHGANELEVTLLFNNEELRKHALANRLYEWLRSVLWKRTIDVETFRIIMDKRVPENFRFEGIYSGESDIQEDDVHGAKPYLNENVPAHKIKYYFSNERHPIVFINTSNHAMSEHDTNHQLWKWEYTGWEKDTSIVTGKKSRKQIERSFRVKRRHGNKI